jgi:hypothetical protein
MSFLGSIGHLMAGSGLREVLETIYAENAVGHILTGKAISRAVRAHFIVDAALNTMLMSETFNVHVNLPQEEETRYEEAGMQEEEEFTDEETPHQDIGTNEDEEIAMEYQEEEIRDEVAMGNNQDHLNADLEEAGKLYDEIMSDPNKADEVCTSEALTGIIQKLANTKDSKLNHRTPMDLVYGHD